MLAYSLRGVALRKHLAAIFCSIPGPQWTFSWESKIWRGLRREANKGETKANRRWVEEWQTGEEPRRWEERGDCAGWGGAWRFIKYKWRWGDKKGLVYHKACQLHLNHLKPHGTKPVGHVPGKKEKKINLDTQVIFQPWWSLLSFFFIKPARKNAGENPFFTMTHGKDVHFKSIKAHFNQLSREGIAPCARQLCVSTRRQNRSESLFLSKFYRRIERGAGADRVPLWVLNAIQNHLQVNHYIR